MAYCSGMGIVGRKLGMTRLFTDDGVSLPVTVIAAGKHCVTAIKTVDRDGYQAVKVSGTKQKEIEFRCDGTDLNATIVDGAGFDVGILSVGQRVDVTGRSRGKGFQGGIKRWNFHRQDMTHGNSLSHRSNGSIGQCQTPGRVWKGKKMSGHMGNRRVTVQGLEIIQIDRENGLVLIKGAVPGAPNTEIVISPTSKSAAPVQMPELDIAATGNKNTAAEAAGGEIPVSGDTGQ